MPLETEAQKRARQKYRQSDKGTKKRQEYYQAHKEELMLRAKEYYQTHVDALRKKREKKAEYQKGIPMDVRGQYNKTYRERSRRKIKFHMKKYHLAKKYNLSIEEYTSMLAYQYNSCAICKRVFVEKDNICVDHDHVTNKIRGLLCMTCNTMLGHAHDNILILESAIDYIRNNGVKYGNGA